MNLDDEFAHKLQQAWCDNGIVIHSIISMADIGYIHGMIWYKKSGHNLYK